MVWGNLPTSTGGNTDFNSKLLEDRNLVVSAFIPSAGTGYTNAIDLGRPIVYPTIVKARVEVSHLTGTSAGDTLTFGLQYSDNNVTFTDIPELTVDLVSVSDVGGITEPDATDVFLPPSGKRYLRARATAPSAGVSGTFTLAVQL